SATIKFTAKTPPTVKISAPHDGTIYPAPQAITLAANAADADGSITGVEFFVNGLSIGTVNAAPWQLAYVIPASGTYDVYAVATDDDGNNTTSATIQFSVPITTPIVSIISPLDGTVFNSPQIVNIQASAVDPNGFITSVQFYVNGISVGSSFFSPWQIGLNATYGTYDVYAIATDNQSNSTISDTIQFSISAIPVNMVEIQVDMNGDDGVEMKDGQIELDNDWIEMAEKGPQDFVLAAYRFTDIPLGPNIQVDSAFLIFQSRGSDDRDPVDLLIYGEDNFNPTPFTNTVGDLSDRPRTQSMISWTPAPWPSAAVEHRSADIAPLVQELIDIPGWANGNAMSFFIAGEGKRSAYAHDNDSTKAAKLKIFYTDLNPTANTAPSIAFTDYDSSLQRIDLTVIPLAVNVQDSTGEISQVVFTINGVTFATDTQYPFETSFIPGANGSYEVIATVSDDGGLSAADTLQIEVDNTLLVQTNNGQISQSNADGEEAELGFVEITDQSIQLVKEKNAGEQYVILHFSGLQIPAGAHIYEAYIQFATQNVNLNYHPIDINIRGEYEPNSNLLQNTNGNISSRSFTQASINWRPRIWTVPDESGPRQRTPDLTDLVREMVNHPNWSDNSPLSFIMSGMGGRAAHSFDSDPNQAAELVIKYKPELPLARGPYLQSGSDTSIVVRFQTQGAKMTELRYGTSLANLNQNIISSTAAVDHRFPIEGLTPNTRYYYEVRVGGQAVAPASNLQYWETAPTSTTIDTVRAWVLGDAGTGNGDARAVRDAYYDYLGDKHTDMILMLGDNAFPNGTQDDYQAAIFENMYEELLARTVLWTSPGERDFANGFTDSNTELGPYYDIFDLPRNGEAGGMASGTEAYYSYNYSNVHFVSLDVFGSDLSPAGGMQSWLSADLATNNQDWTVVFLHHSPYSKGTFDSDTTSIMAAVRQNILPILDTYKVDLVLGAHSQGYERSYLSQGHYGSSQTLTDSMILSERSGNPAIDGPYAKSPNNGLGTVYVVSGSAGTTSPANYGHPIMYQGDSKMGASVLEVFDRTLDFKFLDSTGNIFDHFQIIKGEAPAVSLLTPSDGAVIPAPQNVSITANATDSDGNVLSVDFMVNGALVGTDLTAPWTQAWTPPANGIYEIVAVATDDDGIVSYSEPISLFVGNSFSICIPISSGGNDVEENAAGEMDLRNGALRMINNNGSQQIGLRFERPNILPGAVINDAYIQFTADTVHTASTLLFFEIEEAFPSAPFGNQANEVSGRTYQGGIVSWNVPTWANAGDATIDQQSPDLANQIEQYVSHPSYQLNQPITYRVSGSGLRRARAYDQKSGDQAVLCVNFELPETCHPIADAAAITVWHKADEGIYENNGSNAAETGDGVARWQNFALAGGDAQQLIAGKRPIYTEPTATGVFNGSGGISFGSNRSFELPDNWQENTYRVMIVQRSAPAVSKQAILASASGPNKPYIQIYKEGQSYYYFMGTDTQNETLLIGSDVGTGSEYHVIDVFNVNDQLQATLDANPHNSVNLTADPLSSTFLEQITLGEDPNDDLADFQGEIAEVLVFERDLSGVEFGQIMTYLSVKYGIKIPAAAHNYYTDGTYDNRLFGIGQNLADLCLQKTNSRSVMPDNRVRFSEPSELDEGEFLISGDNGDPFTPFSTQVPLGFVGRLNRIYKVAETGDVGTISLEFDMDGLGVNLGQPGRFFLLKDQDGDFSDAQIANSNIATISGTNLRFTEVDFADGDLYTIAYGEGIQISPKVMLSGPYDLFSGFMNDGLRSNGYLPLREPYEAMASYTHIGYGGGETVDPSVFTLAGNNAIVDWVFIELRDVHDSTQVLATRSALLQRDGDVVDIDGSSAVFFPAVAAGDYFVAIRHRNHLPVMTASSVALSATSISLDFSDPSSPTYGENAQKSLSATTMGLWSGDVNQDHQLVFQGVGNDVQSIFLKVLTDPANTSFARNYVVNGYELTDVNMDGQSIFQGGGSDVTGIFVNILSFPANTGFNRNYVISGQLP
ncbi:MAG: Ig-like domain-containing protein, partial [Bacteroidota bacterium]